MPTALITGVSGQDGSYLAEYLLAKEYRVLGTVRDVRSALGSRHARALAGVELVEAPLLSVADIVRREKPDEVYHLGGPSSVAESWKDPAATETAIVLATALLVEALLETLPSPRLFLAASCEILAAEDKAQDESAPRNPQSPYGKAKLEAMSLVQHARERYGLYAVNGILFNHESPRRGENFVSQRIARGAARIARGAEATLTLGNLDIRRDWGFAGDFVRAMWLMMFQEEPEDLVIGTGEAHSIAGFCEVAFRHAGLDWREHVMSDPSLFRANDAPLRLANPRRARMRLGWTPEVDFQRLVAMMVAEQLTGQLKVDS